MGANVEFGCHENEAVTHVETLRPIISGDTVWSSDMETMPLSIDGSSFFGYFQENAKVRV